MEAVISQTSFDLLITPAEGWQVIRHKAKSA